VLKKGGNTAQEPEKVGEKSKEIGKSLRNNLHHLTQCIRDLASIPVHDGLKEQQTIWAMSGLAIQCFSSAHDTIPHETNW
jgi:hypothetical protein